MAAYFYDIDGTLVYHHTNEWLPGALEHLKKICSEGNQIHLITMRGPQDEGKEWSVERTKETLIKDLIDNEIDFTIRFAVQSPRILVDDRACGAVHRTTNDTYLD